MTYAQPNIKIFSNYERPNTTEDRTSAYLDYPRLSGATLLIYWDYCVMRMKRDNIGRNAAKIDKMRRYVTECVIEI